MDPSWETRVTLASYLDSKVEVIVVNIGARLSNINIISYF